MPDGDRMDLEEFHRLRLADARRRYEENRTAETKKAYLAALAHFATWCVGGIE
jgi:HD superfamily phosphohydrolase YqeK